MNCMHLICVIKQGRLSKVYFIAREREREREGGREGEKEFRIYKLFAHDNCLIKEKMPLYLIVCVLNVTCLQCVSLLLNFAEQSHLCSFLLF